MRAAGHDAPRAVLDDGLGGVDDGSRSIDHIVVQQHITTGNIADDMQHLGDVLTLATLVNDPQRGIQPTGKGPCPGEATGVGGDDHELEVMALFDVL